MTSAFGRPIITAVAAIAVCATAAEAANPVKTDPGRAAVVQALVDCRKLTEDPARLACYDKAAGELDQAESKGQVVVIDRAQVREVRRQAFGFNLPSFYLFTRGTAKTEDGVDHLDLDLESAHHNSEGRWVFVAANGAVWRQTETEEMASDPHKGSKLLIKKGILGGFFCKLDGQPQVRCERVS